MKFFEAISKGIHKVFPKLFLSVKQVQILVAVLAVVVVASVSIPIAVSAANKSKGGGEYSDGLLFSSVSGGYKVSVGSAKNATEIIIPSTYKGKPVVEIGNDFRCPKLEKLTIPFVGASPQATGYDALFGYIFGTEGYTGGGETYQFNGKLYPVSYYIPISLKTVKLTNAERLGVGAFENCDNLKEIILSSGITTISNWAFEDCSSLTSVTIPSGVKTIGDSAFYNCNSLKAIIIPNNVTKVGCYVFSGCPGIKIYCAAESKPSGWDSNWDGYSYPYPVVYWGYGESTLPTGLVYSSVSGGYKVSVGALTNATEITIPSSYNGKSVVEIGSDFGGCANLKKLTIPFVGATLNGTSSTYLGYIFGAGYYSQNSYVPASLKNVIVTGGTSIGDYAFYNCSGLTSITIPNNVTSIGSDAFDYCSGLTTITIPYSVTSIGSYAFYGWKATQTINIKGRSSAPVGWLSGWSSWDSGCSANIVWNA
ncbi:MAG: leucine-rich repeat protein [Clostridiales bacterium]|jgi:hypothetical protein|nr:leucine-rich repeat protein [Clostridiales bacterium]